MKQFLFFLTRFLGLVNQSTRSNCHRLESCWRIFLRIFCIISHENAGLQFEKYFWIFIRLFESFSFWSLKIQRRNTIQWVRNMPFQNNLDFLYTSTWCYYPPRFQDFKHRFQPSTVHAVPLPPVNCSQQLHRRLFNGPCSTLWSVSQSRWSTATYQIQTPQLRRHKRIKTYQLQQYPTLSRQQTKELRISKLLKVHLYHW